MRERDDPTPQPAAVDMGYLSLPAGLQQAVERHVLPEDVFRAALLAAARTRPSEKHGQLCPCWTRKADVEECDCWIVNGPPMRDAARAAAQVAYVARLAVPAPDGAREARERIYAELARHTRGRLRTDRDGFHRTDCSCGWASSPWQRDDRFRDEKYNLITAREALDAEWRQHVAAALAVLLSEGGEGR